jgi:hypothetical protein
MGKHALGEQAGSIVLTARIDQPRSSALIGDLGRGQRRILPEHLHHRMARLRRSAPSSPPKFDYRSSHRRAGTEDEWFEARVFLGCRRIYR